MSYVTSNITPSKYFVIGKAQTLFCTQFLDTFILFHIPKFLFTDITSKYFNDTFSVIINNVNGSKNMSVWKHDVTIRRLLLGYCVIPQKFICGAMVGNCNQVWFSFQILSRIPTVWSKLIFRKISNFPGLKVCIKWQ